MRNLILIICIILVCGNLFCQEEIKVETKEDLFKTKIPFKAGALSFFVPGGGQFYNEKYFKCAFVFALEGTLIGLATYHNYHAERNYDKYKQAVEDTLYALSENYYSKYVNFYEKKQSDFWWLGTVIFLSTIDAFVDAHLFDYEQRKNKIHLKFEGNMISLQYNF